MSAAVDLLLTWSDLDREQRLQALEAVVNETLEEYGYSDVAVESGDVIVADGYAMTSSDGSTVTFHEERTLESENAADALDTAYHEAGHAMRSQDGGAELLTDEERATFNDYAMEGTLDDEGEPGIEYHLNPFHEDVEHFASYKVDQALDEAAALGYHSTGAPASSTAPVDTGGSASESNAPAESDVIYAPDFDPSRVVVTPEPADGFSVEIGEPHVEGVP